MSAEIRAGTVLVAPLPVVVAMTVARAESVPYAKPETVTFAPPRAVMVPLRVAVPLVTEEADCVVTVGADAAGLLAIREMLAREFVGVPDGAFVVESISPSATDIEFVAEQVVAESAMVHVRAVSVLFLRSVKTRDLPEPGAVDMETNILVTVMLFVTCVVDASKVLLPKERPDIGK